ncbi:UNVERIFIED_CONTAM: hypothetical protein Sindi_2454900 [Sesamum indicum]
MSKLSRHEQEGRLHLTNEEKQQMIEIASRNVMVEHERRLVSSAVGRPSKRGLMGEQRKAIVDNHVDGNDRMRRNMEQIPGTSRVRERSVTASSNIRMREPAISRAEVETVGKQIEKLKQQIDDLKKRGDLVKQNRISPFTNKILTKVMVPNFLLPDLPKYNGSKDSREHISTFKLVMNLYGQTFSINAKLLVTTLTGKAQEWFTSFPSGTIRSYGQLVQKFALHFASKRKSKRSATHLFMIRQGSDKFLKNFIEKFNNETLEVQDLRIDMMTSILIHGLQKGPFASALARDPPGNVEQLMHLAHKYIDEKEMNPIKDKEWEGGRDRDRQRLDEEKPIQLKYHKYTPLITSREQAMMMVEGSGLLRWRSRTRTSGGKDPKKYCKFHREKRTQLGGLLPVEGRD